ncbi:MAG: S1/P1 nuclease [Gemmataceae bacterium]|nr:S1/P1 nuclease [Gemmataceae bacterium]
MFSWNLRRLSGILVVCFAVPAALAWNKPGHMTSGAIAYEELKSKNPQALAKVVKLLKEHPHFEDWAPIIALLPAEDRDLYLFMKAARWPDDARDDDEFGGKPREPWHFINFPFKPDGQPESVKTKPPLDVNILTQFDSNSKRVVNGKLDDEKRAVALCWVFHLVGDVHQPLHTSTLFTEDFPNGDRGGTRFYIRATPTAKTTMSLHTFWDGLVIGSDKPKSVKNRGIEIRNKFSRKDLEELAEKSFSKWAAESFELAKTAAYRNGKLQGSRDEDNGTPLPKGYSTECQAIAHRRIALAGYRLADLLEEWFKE